MYSYTPKNGTNSGCDLTVEVVGEGFKTQYNYEAIDYEMTIGRKLRKDLFLSNLLETHYYYGSKSSCVIAPPGLVCPFAIEYTGEGTTSFLIRVSSNAFSHDYLLYFEEEGWYQIGIPFLLMI